eukprot:TRINITY_DN1660_c0_g2_i3.p1 TRINITY_DN1660_c0_g2~~TRINITY_DN1660_c0_g2_i3.p1  ORF type:complete len:238 (-),score=45.88 TRINITY_DN1660_c0_g2_i3:191-904(-)
MHIDRDTGYIAASLSPFLLGTAYTLQKAQKVRDTNVAMPIYQVYVALGMQFTLIFALLIADGDDRGHPHHYFLALLAGCVYAMAAGCSLLAIRHVGVSFSLVAVCVVSAMVSFFWGKVVFQESTQNIYLAMVGMVVVVFGIVLFAYIVPQGKEEDEEEDEEQVASAGDDPGNVTKKFKPFSMSNPAVLSLTLSDVLQSRKAPRVRLILCSQRLGKHPSLRVLLARARVTLRIRVGSS